MDWERDGRKARGWTVRQCRYISAHLKSREIVPQGDVDACLPAPLTHEHDIAGAIADESVPITDWIEAYGQLRAWLWTQEDLGNRANAELQAIAALNSEPEKVTLSTGDTVEVHPKSFHALLWFHTRDWLFRWLLQKSGQLMEGGDYGDYDRHKVDTPVSMIDAAHDEVAHQLAIMCAVACTPGPELPDWADSWDPPSRLERITARVTKSAPAWFFTLSPVDLLLVYKAHREVNAGRLASLQKIVGGKKGKPMPWSVLWGTVAQKKKVDADHLIRHKALASVLAEVKLGERQIANDDVSEAFGDD